MSADVTKPRDLVVPAAIPWAELKQEHLEELLYWLLDDIGVRDLVWRRGGTGSGASDSGRDIEGTLFQPTQLGEIQPQRYWVEAKGRKGTVESSAVKEAVLGVTSAVDVLIVATNTQFSNPTIDWVREWQAAHPRPRVWLWQREMLERQICAHPAVAARLFSAALSPQGRLDLMTSRFWNYAHYCSTKDLSELWNLKGKVEWTSDAVVAMVMGEAANGDLCERPWLAEMPDESMADILVTTLGNLLPLSQRAERVGSSTEPLVDGGAYIVLSASRILPVELCAQLVTNPWMMMEDHFAAANEGMASILREHMTMPVVRTALQQVADACIHRCRRISLLGELNKVEADRRSYWRRYAASEADAPESDERVLYLEEGHLPCEAGFHVNNEKRCPILNRVVSDHPLEETIGIFRQILDDLVTRGRLIAANAQK